MRRHADPHARGRTEVSAQARHPAPEDLKSASRIRVTSLMKIKTTRLILSQSSARGHASRYSDAARPSQPHTPVQAPRAVRFVRPRRPRHREPSPGTHLAKSPRALGAVARADLLHPRQRRSGVPRVRATDHAARRVLRRNQHGRAPQRRRRGSARRAVLRGTGRLLEVRERATSRCDFLSAHTTDATTAARVRRISRKNEKRKNTITTRRAFVFSSSASERTD